MNSYLTGIKTEFSHIQWPKRETALMLAIIIIIVAAAVGFGLGALDQAFAAGLRTLLGL
jgi:preprotein translocase SecE subunit